MDKKRFSFSGRVSGRHILSTMTAVFSFDDIRKAIDEMELSMRPSGWTLKEPCEGCEEEKKKKRTAKPRREAKEKTPAVQPVILEPSQDADNVTAAGVIEADDA